MARYPGTQFVLRDHSNVSAAVPLQQVSNSAPVYMSTFRAPKGPEDMLLVEGQRFYNLYGSQDKIKFNTYKQPLLQASMDINEGARMISKRAVLDSAKLANATFGVVLTQQKTVTLSKNDDGYLNGATLNSSPLNYYIRPVVVSIADTDTTTKDDVIETKYMYTNHKNTITKSIESVDTFQMETSSYGTVGESTKVTLLDGVDSNDEYVIGQIKNGNTNEIAFVTPEGNPTNPTYEQGDTDAQKKAKERAFLKDVYDKAVCGEYFFPLFTIFDNGRGVSLKNYSIVFDVNTSKSINTAVYTLKIADAVTGRNIESFAFTIDPYTRNTNTGYTFDIESAVNIKSDQIKVKYYYDSYDKLVQVLSEKVGTPEDIFDVCDVIFGHKTNGQALNKVATGIVTNEDLYTDPTSAVNNIDVDSDQTTTFYYYDYQTRYKNNISETLLYGFDGIIDETVHNDTTYMNKTASVAVANVLKDETNADITTVSAGQTKTLGFMSGSQTSTSHDACDNSINFLKKLNLDINFGGVDYTKSNATTLFINTSGGNYVKVTAKITSVTPTPSSTPTSYSYTANVTVEEYTWELSYQEQYRRFFNGNVDRDIFNLDVWFPNCVFDCNYDKKVKLAIQRLAAYRGDFFVYLDLNTEVKSYQDVSALVPATDPDVEFPVEEEGATQYYIHDRNCAVTSIYGDIRDPYSNKQITVTGTYPLSRLMVKHFINGVGRPFAGQGYGIVFSEFIEGTVNYIPKIYPQDSMTSRSFIGDTYPSDDPAIINEKQLMTDLKVNYGSYYNGVFTMDTEFTLNSADSDFSYINNIMLVHQVMQAVRKACPASRYRFIDNNDLSTYQKSVEEVLKVYRSKFAALRFKYVQDENSVANKIYYAAIEVVFRPFAQAEIFTITALNYSSLSDNVTTV